MKCSHVLKIHSSSQNITEFIQILPSTISNSKGVIDRESLQSTLQLYEGDLPFVLSFDAELEMWQQHCTADQDLGSQLNTPEKVLHYADRDLRISKWATKDNGYSSSNQL